MDTQLIGEDGQLSLTFSVNSEELTRVKERDGRYLLASNPGIRGNPLSDEEMLSYFKSQDRIEKHIRTFKGPIRVRPIFLHNQEHIEFSYVCWRCWCFLSWRCWHGIAMTGESILKQFQTMTVVYTIFRDGSCWKQVAPLTQFQNEFIQALGLPDPDVYLVPIKLE